MDTIRANVASLSDDVVYRSETVPKKKDIFPSTINLMVVSKLVPPKKAIRCHLPHHPEHPSVCLIVKDIDKSDYNKTVDAWKLRWKADSSTVSIPCSSPSFLPLRELKVAYQTFAAKQRLSATFDVFLADRRIVHHLPNKLGKAFYGGARSKIPVPVNITNRNIAQVVKNELSTTVFQIRGLGASESIPVGNTQTSLSQLTDNILHVCEKVCSDWPYGGLDNIRSIYLQCPKGNIPIYFDAIEAPAPQIQSHLDHLDEQSRRAPATLLLDGTSGTPLSSSRKMLTAGLLAQLVEDLPVPRNGLTRKKRKLPGKPRLPGVSDKKKLRKK